jgi:hypothetical protein
VDFLDPPKESASEPFYDPIHLATILVSSLAVMGVLYWLLWTLLVYEGGLPLKLRDLAQIFFSGRKLSDFGWQGWEDPGDFRGWLGNVCALLIAGLAVGVYQRVVFKRNIPRESSLK